MNRSMLRKLVRGEVIDVSECDRTDDGFYVLKRFVEGKDYADCAEEEWIWSIGKRRTDGVILASTSNVLYQNPDFDCLFLR
jgi:hypothetical protein